MSEPNEPRTATSADIESLLALANQSPTAAHWSRRQYEEALTPDSVRRLVLVLDEASTVQAFIVAHILDTEWEIENVVVSSTRVRQGLGTRLVQAVVKLAGSRHAGAVYLEVRESNQAARALYQKLAFAECGRRKGYYRAPSEDAVLYRLPLV